MTADTALLKELEDEIDQYCQVYMQSLKPQGAKHGWQSGTRDLVSAFRSHLEQYILEHGSLPKLDAYIRFNKPQSGFTN